MPDPSTRIRGWLFVGAQAVLLVTLVALPSAGHWPVGAVLRGVALVIIVAGVAVAGAAALGLGRALTPTPVPNGQGELRTTGLYGLARHPIYAGVLLAVVGIVARSGNLITLAVGVATLLFFNSKAAWEEKQLRQHFPDYSAYEQTTPRFVPHVHRFRRIRH